MAGKAPKVFISSELQEGNHFELGDFDSANERKLTVTELLGTVIFRAEGQGMTKKKNTTSDREPIQVGRKRDHTRDTAILDATLDVLAEVGAAGLTMDLVAARAGAGKGTIYRRWTSKENLVIDAIARMKRSQVNMEQLPDTGTLRGDLLGLFRPQPVKEGQRRLKIMAGLATLLSQEPALADAANAAVVQPWAEAHFTLMRRALERGEIPDSADIATLSQLLPTLAAYRTLVQRKQFDYDFLLSMIDGVILPALRNPPGLTKHLMKTTK